MKTFRSTALLAALTLSACGGSVADLGGNTPRAFLVDARSGGAVGFWFLPPIAPEPDDATPNHRGLTPVVQVEEVEPGAAGVIATFTEVKDAGAHYQADWAASDASLVPGRTYRIEVLLSGATLGYADAEVAEDGSELRFLYSEETFPLTGERTLPIKFRIAEPAPDADADRVPDASDDCPSVSDPVQLDSDGDGVGDACECLEVACTQEILPCHTPNACDPATGVCAATAVPDGTPCPFAEGTGVCEAGQCVAPPAACGTCDGCQGGCDSCSGTTAGTCPMCGKQAGECSCSGECGGCSGPGAGSGGVDGGGMASPGGMDGPSMGMR